MHYLKLDNADFHLPSLTIYEVCYHGFLHGKKNPTTLFYYNSDLVPSWRTGYPHACPLFRIE